MGYFKKGAWIDSYYNYEPTLSEEVNLLEFEKLRIDLLKQVIGIKGRKDEQILYEEFCKGLELVDERNYIFEQRSGFQIYTEQFMKKHNLSGV